MRHNYLVLILVTGLLSSAAFAQASSIRLTANYYPSHGLPGMPASLFVTITNDGATPLLLSGVDICLEGAGPDGSSFSIPCGDTGSPMHLQNMPGDAAIAGSLELKPHDSRTFVQSYGDVGFIDPRLRAVGRHTLRAHLAGTAAVSADFDYTIDEPVGDNAVMWPYLRDRYDQGGMFSYATMDWTQLCREHSNSDYCKVWRSFQTGLAFSRDENSAQNLIALGLPEPIGSDLQFGLGVDFQRAALRAAARGDLDKAEQLANQGKAILQTFVGHPNPFIAADAVYLLSNHLWTRQELAKAAQATLLPVQHVKPRVSCVILNSDGTFTAWFGYDDSKNTGFFQIPIGPQNMFDGRQPNMGQPVNFGPGIKDKVFSVSASVGEKLVWLLDGQRATASANESSARCDSPSNQPR